MEPDKCDGWEFVGYDEMKSKHQLFLPLQILLEIWPDSLPV